MKLTKIAIALAAMLAMTAVVASGASAAQYRSETSPVSLTGNQTETEPHVFTVDGQNVKCNTATFNKASLATPANEVNEVAASYSGCTAFGFAATVNMGNCTYGFQTPTEIENKDTHTFKVKLACSGATPVVVKTNVLGSECEVTIAQANNENLSHIVSHNTTPPNVKRKKLTWTITITLIQAIKNKDNGFCPLSGTGTVNNATYNGGADVVGNGENGIWIE